MQNLLCVLLSSGLSVASLAANAASPGPMSVRAGSADGANVAFVFHQKALPRGIEIRTVRVGVAGSVLSVYVDRAKAPLLRHVFSASECKFVDAGSSCTFNIVSPSQDYSTLVRGFRKGRQARVTIVDAGVMSMDHTASLKGVTMTLGRP